MLESTSSVNSRSWTMKSVSVAQQLVENYQAEAPASQSLQLKTNPSSRPIGIMGWELWCLDCADSMSSSQKEERRGADWKTPRSTPPQSIHAQNSCRPGGESGYEANAKRSAPIRQIGRAKQKTIFWTSLLNIAIYCLYLPTTITELWLSHRCRMQHHDSQSQLDTLAKSK